MVSLKVILTILGIAAVIFTFFYSGNLTAVIIIAFSIVIILAFMSRNKSGESGKDIDNAINDTLEKERKQREKEEKEEETEKANEATTNKGIEQAKALQAQEAAASTALAQDLQKNNYIITNDNLSNFLNEIKRLGSIINAQYQWVDQEAKRLEIEYTTLMNQLADLKDDENTLKDTQNFVSSIVGDLKPALSAIANEMVNIQNQMTSFLKDKLNILPLQKNELTSLKDNALKSLQFLKEAYALLEGGKGGEAKAFLDSAKIAETIMAQNFAKFQELQSQISQLSGNIDNLQKSAKKHVADFINTKQSFEAKQAEAAQMQKAA